MGILTWLLWGALLAGAAITIYGVITTSALREQLREKQSSSGDNGLYLEVTRVQPNTVSATYYNRHGNRVEDVKFESSDGVSGIYEGQRIS